MTVLCSNVVTTVIQCIQWNDTSIPVYLNPRGHCSIRLSHGGYDLGAEGVPAPMSRAVAKFSGRRQQPKWEINIVFYLLTLTLIQPASTWIHLATLWRHSDLFWAATSTSSRVIPTLIIISFIHPYQVLVDCAPQVCTWTLWTSLKPRNLPVQRLSRYALVIHSYHMSKPAKRKNERTKEL